MAPDTLITQTKDTFIARENTDLVIETINDSVDGIRDSKPLSEGVKSLYQTAILTGISITAATVIINQSQHKWFADAPTSSRPKKRIKK